MFRTVVNKVDGITNEYRNFELDLLAGEEDYVTETLEGGVRYRLDFSKVPLNFHSFLNLIGVRHYDSITKSWFNF